MPKTLVWKPENEKSKVSETKPDATSKPSAAEKKRESGKKLMSDAFWDEHIHKGDSVTFRFLDDSELSAKILDTDIYHLMVEIDGKQRLLFKHALKWAE